LVCNHVSKLLGGRTVLDDLSLSVRAGEVVSLVGASGSGKTTLLRVISGLVDPDAGEISIDGRSVWRSDRAVPAEQRGVGMVFQDYALWPHMSVAKNLSFGLESRRLPAKEIAARMNHALDVTRLGPFRDRHPHELSGVQQQRVAIARCLAARPALMLFDEPLSNLDAALREGMRDEMMELVRREGITVVYVTHDQAEAMAVSDRIAVMRDGVIAQFDTPQAIYDRPANAFVAGFIGGFSLLHGTVDGGLFRPAGAELSSLAAPDAPSGSGDFVIRPEDARPAADHPDRQLRGTMVSGAVQGRCWRLVAQIGPQRIRLDWSQAVSPGVELTFSLPPDRCLVLGNGFKNGKIA
jgi:ABC-type Fe3+/spermidine/putrescine transport system ATPase subunit